MYNKPVVSTVLTGDLKMKPITINSFTEGLKMNAPFNLPEDREFYLYTGEKIEFQVLKKSFNRTIMVFPSKAENGFFKLNTEKIIMRLKDYLKDLKDERYIYSAGYYFRGQYYEKEMTATFDRSSFSIELVNMDKETSVNLAKEFLNSFDIAAIFIKHQGEAPFLICHT